MKLKIEFLKGNNTEAEWSGVYGYQSDEEKDSFELYSVCRIFSTADINLEIIAKTFWNELQNSFLELGKKHTDIALRLEDAIWKMKAKTEALLSRDATIMEKGIDMEMSVIIFAQNVIYCAVIGESKILIYRNNKLVDISKALVDLNMSGFVKFGSLKLEPADRILLSVSKGLNDEKTESIKKTMEELDISVLNFLETETGSCAMILGSDSLDWPGLSNQNISVETTEPTIVDSFTKRPEESFEDKTEQINEPIQEEIDTTIISDEVDNPAQAYGKTFAGFNSKFKFLKRGNRKITSNNNLPEGNLEEGESITSFTSFSKEKELPRENILQKVIKKIRLKNVKIAILAIFSFVKRNISKIINYFKNNKSTYLQVVKNIFALLEKLIGALVELFKREIIGTSDRRDFFVKSKRRSRNRKLLAAFLAILVIVLFFSFKDAEFKRQEQETRNGILAEITKLETAQQEVENKTLLDAAKNEPLKSELILSLNDITRRAEEQDTKIKKIEDGEKKYAQFIANLNRITQKNIELEDKLNNVFSVNITNVEIISDLTSLFPGAKIEDIEFSGGFIYAVDSQNNCVYKTPAVASVDAKVVVSQLEAPFLLAKTVDGDIVVYDNSNSGAIGKIYTKENDRFERFPALAYSNIGNVKSVDIYSGNDALYELRTFPNPYIYKREREGAGYVGGGANFVTVNPPNWRSDSDFSSALDIAVPYEVYVLIEGKGIKRYLGGDANTIEFATYINLTEADFAALNQATALDVRGEYLAVSDPLNKRVLLFHIQNNEIKNLAFVSQFIFRGDEELFSKQKEIIINQISPTSIEIYVLDDGKIIGLNFQN